MNSLYDIQYRISCLLEKGLINIHDAEKLQLLNMYINHHHPNKKDESFRSLNKKAEVSDNNVFIFEEAAAVSGKRWARLK